MLRIIFVLLALTPIAAIAHSPIAYVLPKDGAVINSSPEAIEIVFTGPSKLIKVSLQKFARSKQITRWKSTWLGEGVDIALVGKFLMREENVISFPFQRSKRVIIELIGARSARMGTQ